MKNEGFRILFYLSIYVHISVYIHIKHDQITTHTYIPLMERISRFTFQFSG